MIRQVQLTTLIVAALSLFMVTSPFAHARDISVSSGDLPVSGSTEIHHHGDKGEAAGSAELHCGAHVLTAPQFVLGHVVPEADQLLCESATVRIQFSLGYEPPPPRT